MSVAALAFLASACRGSDVVEPQSPGSGFSLEEFAGILSALPMDRSHLGEVFDAVCASSENGYAFRRADQGGKFRSLPAYAGGV